MTLFEPLVRRLARHSKMIGVVSALLLFASWFLTTVLQTRLLAEAARLATFAGSIESFGRERHLLARLDGVASAVNALRGVDERTNVERAVAVFDKPSPSDAEMSEAVRVVGEDIFGQRTQDRYLLFEEEVESIRAVAASIERYVSARPLAGILFGLAALERARTTEYAVLRQPLKAVNDLIAQIEAIDREDQLDVSGFAAIGRDQEAARAWLQRRRAREIARMEKMTAVRRSGLLMARGGAALRESAENTLSINRDWVRAVETAALSVFAIGTLLAVGSKYLETRTPLRRATEFDELPID